jgi:hypothetical protein
MIRDSINRLSNFVRRLLRRKPEPLDPYAYIHAPLRRGLGGRGAAVAVEEPEEPGMLGMIGNKAE